MKSKKINVLLVLMLAISLVLTTTVFASAATVKISKKSANLDVGKTTIVKVLNTSKKVTWTTSKKSVATVKSTGTKSAKITAVKAGTATITAKVGTKKYTCKITVTNPIGSRANPADPTAGVTLKASFGTMYFKVNRICSGPEAESWYKSLDMETWNFYQEYESEEFIGKKLVGIEYDVVAKSGYDEYGLSGLDIINPYSLYNGNCNASLSSLESLMLDSETGYQTASDLSLYGGGASKMYEFILVPEDITSFSTKLYTSTFNTFWVKYTF